MHLENRRLWGDFDYDVTCSSPSSMLRRKSRSSRERSRLLAAVRSFCARRLSSARFLWTVAVSSWACLTPWPSSRADVCCRARPLGGDSFAFTVSSKLLLRERMIEHLSGKHTGLWETAHKTRTTLQCAGPKVKSCQVQRFIQSRLFPSSFTVKIRRVTARATQTLKLLSL